MTPAESLFPPAWWGVSLDIAGLAAQRPDGGTYAAYDASSLPPLPCALDGYFGWLAHGDAFDQHVGQEGGDRNAERLPGLLASAQSLGLALPSAFALFLGDTELQARVPSCTDCFLFLPSAPVMAPRGDGWLVHFLADSQGCLFWYLFLRPGDAEAAVLCSTDFWGAPEDSDEDAVPDPDTLVWCAPSFEAFICRFWVENVLWLDHFEGEAPGPAASGYARAYALMPAAARSR